ncbi:MAG: hypothetical protein Q4C75_07570, partial [Bergeyella zoohelcum]|nr:hypothetical protein [Bergeyella zoohelcum]
ISIFYTLISFIPFYHFYIASSNIFNLSKAFFDKFTLILLLFFPSVHFWLASFGKDAFCFVGLCFMLYVVNRKIKNTIFIKVLFIITFLLLFFVRPYIGIIFAIIYLFLERRSIGIRFYFIVPILLIGGYVFLVKFIKFESLDFEYISKKFYILDSYAKTGGSIIDLEKTNVFTRFFYMMFRPFLFEAKNFHQFIVSIENFILLIWFVWLFIRVKRDKIVLNKKILWYASFSILLWLFYSLYIYNYGLASRMKATILPILFYSVILWRENILKLKKSIE